MTSDFTGTFLLTSAHDGAKLAVRPRDIRRVEDHGETRLVWLKTGAADRSVAVTETLDGIAAMHGRFRLEAARRDTRMGHMSRSAADLDGRIAALSAREDRARKWPRLTAAWELAKCGLMVAGLMEMADRDDSLAILRAGRERLSMDMERERRQAPDEATPPLRRIRDASRHPGRAEPVPALSAAPGNGHASGNGFVPPALRL